MSRTKTKHFTNISECSISVRSPCLSYYFYKYWQIVNRIFDLSCNCYVAMVTVEMSCFPVFWKLFYLKIVNYVYMVNRFIIVLQMRMVYLPMCI